MKKSTGQIVIQSSVLLSTLVLAVACGQGGGGSLSLQQNAANLGGSSANLSESMKKSFPGYVADRALSESVLGATAETANSNVATGSVSGTISAVDVKVKVVVRSESGEAIALQGTSIGVKPRERRLLQLNESCGANGKYEIEIACGGENCAVLRLRLILKAEIATPSLAESAAPGAAIVDAGKYRQTAMMFEREGAQALLKSRRAMRMAQKTGATVETAGDTLTKVTTGLLKRIWTERGSEKSGARSADVSFDGAVTALRTGKENISLVNACVDQTGAPSAIPVSTEVQPQAGEPVIAKPAVPAEIVDPADPTAEVK